MAIVGVDTGGTFTDIVGVHEEKVITLKVPSTPKNPVEAILGGLKELGKEMELSTISRLVLGTTVGTNAIIQRKGARTALLVTEGFADILYLGRQQRPLLYDLFVDKVPPIVNGQHILEVKERALADGSVLTPLSDAEMTRCIQWLREKGFQSVAIVLLHSYCNADHEMKLEEAIRKAIPDIYISTSSTVAPEIKEYERASTTAIDAYIKPIMLEHLKHLDRELKVLGIPELLIMQSNGGIMPASQGEMGVVSTINSGPAAGVIAGGFFGGLAGFKNLIALDMGGTSCDISVIMNGEPLTRPEFELSPLGHASSIIQTGLPVRCPTLDVNCIGAGGGSIAWVDVGGMLKVGPHSAGADPGPACYGRGGDQPTVTDAHLVLGRLNPESFGGGIALKVDLAREAIRKQIGDPLAFSVEEAASGIIRVVNSNMLRGMRVATVEIGLDARELALVIFGGAGALHGAELARELKIDKVIVPPNAGVTSAYGLLVSDFRYYFVTTYISTITGENIHGIYQRYGELENEALSSIKSTGTLGGVELVRTADLRYVGQGYTLNVPIPQGDFGDDTVDMITSSFNKAHEAAYGYARKEQLVECVNVRVMCISRIRKIEAKRVNRKPAQDRGRVEREVFFGDDRYDTHVTRRDRISPGQKVLGPAIIDEETTTVAIPPYAWATIDDYDNLIMTVG